MRCRPLAVAGALVAAAVCRLPLPSETSVGDGPNGRDPGHGESQPPVAVSRSRAAAERVEPDGAAGGSRRFGAGAGARTGAQETVSRATAAR